VVVLNTAALVDDTLKNPAYDVRVETFGRKLHEPRDHSTFTLRIVDGQTARTFVLTHLENELHAPSNEPKNPAIQVVNLIAQGRQVKLGCHGAG
jgi:hypothetical protein